MRRGFLLTVIQLTIVLVIILALMINSNNNGINFGGIHLGSLSGFTIYDSQPDASSGKDTYIKQNFNITNYGTDPKILIGKDPAGRDLRGIIEFNLSSIPVSTVLSASLQVNLSYSSSDTNITIKVYRLVSPWLESEATWANASSSQLWGSVGGDYAEEVTFLKFSNISVLYNFTITNLVKGWINGSYPNYGIILVSNDSSTGNRREIDSSDSATADARPKITINYVENAPPSITNSSSDSNLTNLKQVGESVSFTLSWSDIEGNNAKVYICNSSSISFASGCADKTFCSTSLAATNPIQCSYLVSSAENRTTSFFSAVCDSSNCSDINQSYFYMNHVPSALVVQPNNGEIVNQSQGNYTIKFNVSDSDDDFLFAGIYYGTNQNSTTYLIDSSLNLTNFCTDLDSRTSTVNNCSYSWNSSGVYGTYYLTIIVNDSSSSTNDSSANSFSVKSVADSTPPNIATQSIDADIYSGKQVQISADISDDNTITAWASVNTTPETNVTLRNSSSITYNGSFVAPVFGNYQFKVYARDIVGNFNDSSDWQPFSVRKPVATSQDGYLPPTALPYHVIKVIGELNATDSLRDVYAYLNVPEGFTFLSAYPQNLLIGNFSSNQTRDATWFLSVPLAEATYVLNITYTDYYSDRWNSSNSQIAVTSSIGGGYTVSSSAYSEVETGQNYYSEAYFKSSGLPSSPDSIKISILNPSGATIVDAVSMSLKETGTYNYTYPVPGSGATEGQWETRINATKNSVSYYANQFWKLVGGVFDVRNIIINNNSISGLSINVTLENTGGADKDMYLFWNLTIESNKTYLISGLDTVRVSAYSTKMHTITPSTNFVGQVRITFIGEYSAGEKAGAYEVFSTTSGAAASCGDNICSNTETCSSCVADCGACPSVPSSRGGGGGGGGEGTGAAVNQGANLTVIGNREIYIARNIEKSVSVQVSNNGGKDLTDVSLSLENFDKLLYAVSPSNIALFKKGETKTFRIDFLVPEYLEEQDFNYSLKTNEVSVKEPVKIVVLSISSYLREEIDRLSSRIESLKSSLTDNALKEQLKACENITDAIKLQISNQEIINANDNIQNADDCIDSIESQISPLRVSLFSWFPKLPTLSTADIFWIATSAILIMMIFIVIFFIRKVNTKSKISNFLETREEKKLSQEKQANPVTMDQKYFEDKLKSIHEKLGI